MMLFGQDTARQCGCRIIHEVSVDTVVLRIHAGLIPERPSKDKPVQFMLTVPDLDNLVDWLGDVRKEMVAGNAAADKIIQLHQRRTQA